MSDDGKKKILIATTVASTIRAFLLPYADHLRAAGWQVDAIANGATSDEDIVRRFDKVCDAPWARSPFATANYSAMKLIARLVEENGYDIVHTHTPVASFVTREGLRGLRARGSETTGRPKVVYTAHGFHFFRGGSRRRNALYRMLERRAGRWTDRLIVINREDYAAAESCKIVPREHLVYMPGIGLDFSKYSREQIRREDILAVRTEIGLKEDDILFVMMAEFNPGKRHRDVIEAMSRIPDEHVHVAFAGDGPLRQKMQEMARAYSVATRTHFLGFVKEPNPLIAAARAMLIPSEREGLSRTAMEAACLMVPIIGSDARGVRDVAEHGRGVIYPVGDSLALRDAMMRLAAEPYRTAGPDEDWRIERLLSMHDGLYRELLAEARAERDEYERAEAERAERVRLEEERREAERREREQREAEARARKQAAREEAERAKAERARAKEARKAEKAKAAREAHEQRLAREREKAGLAAAETPPHDPSPSDPARFEWQPLYEQEDEHKN